MSDYITQDGKKFISFEQVDEMLKELEDGMRTNWPNNAELITINTLQVVRSMFDGLKEDVLND